VLVLFPFICFLAAVAVMLVLRNRETEPEERREIPPPLVGVPYDPGVVAPRETEPGRPGPGPEPAVESRDEPVDEPAPGEPERPAAAPDPAPRPAEGPTPEEIAAGARIRADQAVLEEWAEVEPIVAEHVRTFRFDQAVGQIDSILERLQTDAAKTVPAARLEEVVRVRGLFERTVETLAGRAGQPLEVREGLEIQLTSVSEERIEGRRGPATLALRWTDLEAEDLFTVFEAAADRGAETSQALALLGFELGLDEEAEDHLLRMVRADASRKGAADALLARRRGEAVPEGGYVLHEGAWVRPEEKALLDQGYRRWEGRWVTEAEWYAANGYVRHEGRWITQEAHEALTVQQRELEELAARLLPKGLIDQPGHGGGVDWGERIKVKTRNYTIETNLSKEVANDVAYLMETLNSNFRRILGLGTKRMPKFTIQVCRDLQEYRTALKGMGLGQAGGTMIKTFYQPPRTTAVLMHEGTHQFVFKIAPTCPRWVHEGMATFFECSQFRFDEKTRKVRLEVGLLNRHRLMGIQAAIRTDRYAPMDLFLEGKKGNPYTQGWSVIYYLRYAHDGKYARRLMKFVEDAGKGSTTKKFKKIFRIRDIVAWEKDWREFVMGLNPADGVDVFRPEGMGDPGSLPPGGRPGGR
jgi:hypothetical protein